MSIDEKNQVAVPAGSLDLDVTVGPYTFNARGEAEVVLNAFGQFQAIITSPPAPAPAPIVTVSDEPTSVEPSVAEPGEPEQSAPRDRVPLPVFITSKSLPRGNHAIALGIAVWAKRFDDVSELDVETVRNYWRSSGKKLPANLQRDLGNATSTGWLERLSRGSFRLTTYGEAAFDEMPDA